MMPNSPRVACSYPCCPHDAVKHGKCAKHQSKGTQPVNRPNSAQRGYGGTWQKARLMHLARHPLCEMCLENKAIVAAVPVHHIIPLSEGGTSEEANLMSLCAACHNRREKTSDE